MVNQRMLLNPKPVIDLWFKEDFNEDFSINKSPIVYDFQGTSVEMSYFTTVYTFFVSQFDKFSEIKFNVFDKQTVDSSSINICPVICPDLISLEHAIENIDYSLYDKCVENDVIYFFGLMREHLESKTVNVNSISKLIRERIIDKGCSPKHLKIYHVGYGIPKELEDYKDYIISIDSFGRILANTTRTKVVAALPLDRSYNFSMLTGSLRNRYYRCIFLARCNELGILDDNFFYSMVMNNYSSDLDSIKKLFTDPDKPYRLTVLQSCDDLFYNKTYDKDGVLLTKKTIYDDNIEYDIPNQILDSYINIVLETQFNSPCITEKIYKPIMAGLLFLWHGPQNVLPYLMSLGYKKYTDIDYTFDTHPDPTVRMDLLIQEIQRLSKKDLRALVEANQEAIQYNRNFFWKNADTFNDLWEQLSE